MILCAVIAYLLIELHGPGGQTFELNPEGIVSLRVPRKDEGGHFPPEVRCLVNTTDGKFTAVVEDCGTVRVLIEGERKQK